MNGTVRRALTLPTTLLLATQAVLHAADAPKQHPPVQQRLAPSGYTSRVPQFAFAKTLADQERQLKDNPLMLRFAKSRKKLASDRYRPIYPGPERCCFSGSALVEKNRVIAMYHGTEVGNMVATSDDPLLLNWEKLTGQAVIPLKSKTGHPLPYHVYDPCVWERGGIYYSLSGARKSTGPGGKGLPTVYLFRSRDLAKWEYLHEFVQGDRFTLVGDDYAVPYSWPIGDKYLFAFASHMSGGQYLLGDYDTAKDQLFVSGHGRFNFGTYGFPPNSGGVNAPSAAPDGKGGVGVIFNLMNNKPLGEWGQIMSLARRLTLIGSDTLGQEPAGDIASLRHAPQQLGPLELPANKEVVLEHIRGDAMELNLELDPKNAAMIELSVLRSPGKEEFTRITFFKDGGFLADRQGLTFPAKGRAAPPKVVPWSTRSSLVVLDSSCSSQHPDVKYRAPSAAPILLEPNERLRLRLFIDKSVVEVFVNERQAMAERVFPSRDDSLGVSLRAQGNKAELTSLEAWQMKCIYP